MLSTYKFSLLKNLMKQFCEKKAEKKWLFILYFSIIIYSF